MNRLYMFYFAVLREIYYTVELSFSDLFVFFFFFGLIGVLRTKFSRKKFEILLFLIFLKFDSQFIISEVIKNMINKSVTI